MYFYLIFTDNTSDAQSNDVNLMNCRCYSDEPNTQHKLKGWSKNITLLLKL